MSFMFTQDHVVMMVSVICCCCGCRGIIHPIFNTITVIIHVDVSAIIIIGREESSGGGG